MGDDLSISILISFILQSLLFLTAILGTLYLSLSIIRNKSRTDKPKLKFVRIIAQILASTPFFFLVWTLSTFGLAFFSESFSAGCTSGPGIGTCFGMMVITMFLMPITLLAFISGVIAYYLSTVKNNTLIKKAPAVAEAFLHRRDF